MPLEKLTRRQTLAMAASIAVDALATTSPVASAAMPLAERFPPPEGYLRRPAIPESFTAWLRNLPLKPYGSPVLLHSGAPKARQDLHAAVIDIDVGHRDLQQCADAVMRIYAEWQFATGQTDAIAFNDTGEGKPMYWSRWAQGDRPSPSANRLIWARRAAPDASYASFRRYLDCVFAWAGTHSLERQLQTVPIASVTAGDVIIKGGFPGHAVLIVDIANPTTNRTLRPRFLLAQSYMPAQNIHILKNMTNAVASPWYELTEGQSIFTPEWTFPPGSFKRWQ